MIERQCGAIPHAMALKCNNELVRGYLDCSSKYSEDDVMVGTGMKSEGRLKWPQAARKRESVTHVEQMLLLEDIIPDEHGAEHVQFRDMLKQMLVIDPVKRPTASEILRHPFFRIHDQKGG